MTSILSTFSVPARLALGGLFLWSGFAKIPEPAFFALTVRAYDVLPVWAVNPFAVTLPWIEVLAGLLCVVGFWTRSSVSAILTLLGLFFVAIGVNVFRGADFSCGCFGLDGTADSLSSALVKDILLMLVAFYLLRRPHYPLSIDGLLAGSAAPSTSPAPATD